MNTANSQPKTVKPASYLILIVIGILLLLLALVVTIKLDLISNINNVKQLSSTPQVLQATLDESCDLHKSPCKLSLADGKSITLEISPNTIPLLEKLQIRVEVEGITVTKAEIDFTGVIYDLGYNRPKLKAASTNTSKTIFLGDAFLPVCIQGEMDWSAKVLLETDDGLVVVPYKFHTVKKPTIYDSF